MKLDYVEIKNFQCHTSFRVDLGPRLNVVVGPTDGGKSALIRAVRLAMFNVPLGNQFVKHGSSKTIVKLGWEDGSVLRRTKSSAINRVEIDGHEPYNQFGKEYPEEVVSAFGIRWTELAGDLYHLNIGTQHEPYFMLAGWQGSARAAVLDKLCGNDLIGRVVKELNRDVQNLGRDRKRSEERVAEIRTKLRRFDDLDTMVRRQDILERLVEEIEYREQVLENATKDCERLRGVVTDLEAIRPPPEIDGSVLDGLIERNELFSRWLIDLTGVLSVAGIDIPEIDQESLEDLREDHERWSIALVDLEDNRSKTFRIETQIGRNNAEAGEVRGELVALFEEYGVCPLCRSRLDDPARLVDEIA